MIDAGVVVDGAELVLSAVRAHSERGVGLLIRDNFVFDTLRNIFFVKLYVLASITLLYFDHALTFPLEVRRVWSTRFTGASFLFLLNRYIPFFGYIPVLIGMFNPPWDVIGRFAPFVGALSVASNVISAIILILRTYALYNRKFWVLIVTGAFGAASVVIGGWSASSVQGELFNFQPIVVCVPMLIRENGLKYAWIMTFCFDFIVFGLTIARTYQYMRAQSRLHMQSHLTMLLMRDGSIYFLVMSIVNAVNYILSTRLRNSFFTSATGTNSILANVISVTMISRLLLNLREEATSYNRRTPSGARFTTGQSQTDTNLIFSSRILGNLTAEFDHDESLGSSSSRGGSDYTYDFRGEESDGVYELQSRTTRSGLTSRSGHSGRTVSTDPGSSSGTGTISGSSGSGSGSGSGTDQNKRKKGGRGTPKLAWAGAVNTSLSMPTSRLGRGEPQTPATTVGSHVRMLPSGEHSPQLLSPLSPETMYSLSTTLHQPSPRSPYPHSPLSRDQGLQTEDADEKK